MSGNVSNHIWVEDATKPLGGYWKRQTGTADGGALVSIAGSTAGAAGLTVTDIYGSGDVPQNRSLTNVTTLQSVDYPADNGVKFLTIFCWPYADLVDGTAKTDATPTNCVGMIAIDASSDLVAGAWLGSSSTNIPSDASDDQFYIPIPLKQFVKVPLSAVMVNNQIHVRSSDGTALNFWIGGN